MQYFSRLLKTLGVGVLAASLFPANAQNLNPKLYEAKASDMQIIRTNEPELLCPGKEGTSVYITAKECCEVEGSSIWCLYKSGDLRIGTATIGCNLTRFEYKSGDVFGTADIIPDEVYNTYKKSGEHDMRKFFKRSSKEAKNLQSISRMDMSNTIPKNRLPCATK